MSVQAVKAQTFRLWREVLDTIMLECPSPRDPKNHKAGPIIGALLGFIEDDDAEILLQDLLAFDRPLRRDIDRYIRKVKGTSRRPAR